MKGKRLLALLLSVMIMVTYMPALAFAEDGAADDAAPAVTDVQADDDADAEAVQTESEGADAQADAAGADADEVQPAEAAETKTDAAKSGADEAARGNAVVTMKPETNRIKSKVSLDDNDDLLMAYLEKEVAKEVKNAAPSGNGKKAANAKSRRTKLSEPESVIYDELAYKIGLVASGETDSAELYVSLRDVFGKTRYTADELGVASIIDGDELSDEAIDRFNDCFYFDADRVIDALLADMPYELYWYDKTEGVEWDYDSFFSSDGDSIFFVNDNGYEAEDPSLAMRFYVSADYSASGNKGTLEVDTDKTSAAAAFVENSAEVINSNEERSDVDKLYAYKDAICDATDYDWDAAEDSARAYGDPWQLIYVFDGDESTKVVCEGYSKAFQFLCDRTSFDNSEIEAFCVTGDMDGGTGAGAHMWNILHMDDGSYYLADITNCDVDDPSDDGYPSDLFLKGYLSGSADSGYVYGDISYRYDSDTLGNYDIDTELTMSPDDYEKAPVVISYSTTKEYIENRHGEWETDDEGTSYYNYYVDINDGDILTIDGKKYVYDADDEVFVNGEDRIDESYVSIGTMQYDDHWVIPEGELETDVTIYINYKESECQATAKLIKNPVTGIKFTPAKEYTELIEGADGYYKDDGSFVYYRPEFKAGDKLTVSYRNKDDVTYVYKGYRFVNPDNKKDYIYDDDDDDESVVAIRVDNRDAWKLSEGDSYYSSTIAYEGQTTPGMKIRIVPSPVKSISFSRNGESRIELIEGKDSFIDWDFDEETDEELEYVCYYTWFEEGDSIIVNYTDGRSSEYVCNKRGRFINKEDETDKLNRSYLEMTDEPRQSHTSEWQVGKEYKTVVSYMGKSTDVSVSIAKNPVTNVEITFADGSKTAKLAENASGYWDCDWDEDDNRIDYFRYSLPEFEDGDILTVTRDGKINKYAYTYNYSDENDNFIGDAFVNINNGNDTIASYEVDEYGSNQRSDSLWVIDKPAGADYHFIMRYFGVEFNVPAEIVENPVSAIDFTRAGYDKDHPIELIEGLDAMINSDGGKNRFFEYYLDFKNGDTLKITDPKGNVSDYKATADEASGGYVEFFTNDKGDKIKTRNIYHEIDPEQSYKNQWKPGDGTHTITLEYFARTTGVNVVIKQNPVQKLSFSRPGSDGAVELQRDTDGFEVNGKFRYEIPFKAGDELYITYAGSKNPVKYVAKKGEGGKVSEFAASAAVPAGAAATISAEELGFMHNTEEKLAAEGDAAPTIMLMYQGMWTDVPVKLVEKHEHKWDDGKVTTEPSCVDAGVMTYTCAGCGETKTEEIPATGKHTEELIPAVAATCTKTGLSEGKKCSVCGEILAAQKETPALGHKWSEPVYKWNEDYTEVSATHKCSVCGEAESETAKRASSEVTKAPTLTEKGETVYTSEAFANQSFKVQTAKTETELTEVERAIAQAEEQTDDAETKAEGAEGSATEKNVSDAEDASVKAAELAAQAEAAAEEAVNNAANAQAAAQKAYDDLKASGKASDAELAAAKSNLDNAQTNLDNATKNLAVAKKIKAAANSALAKSKKAAAKVASDKAAEFAEKIKEAANSEEAEALRKEAEKQAAIAAEKAASAKTASEAAREAAGELKELAEKLKDEGLKKAVEEVIKDAESSSKEADQAAAEADKKSDEAKASESEAQTVVEEKKAEDEAKARASQKGADGTALGKGASAEVAEAAITGNKTDKDLPGAVFGALQLKSTKQANTSVTLKWKKVAGAKSYVIYGNKCGTKNKMVKLATVSGASKKITKVAGKKVKKGTYYKFMVVALDGENNVVSSSKVIHVATKGGKVGNVKKITTKAKKNKVTVKAKKTFKLKAKQVAASKKLKVKKHVALRYETSNAAVATVSGKGVIKGVGKGKCKVYVYAQNGACTTINVTVK